MLNKLKAHWTSWDLAYKIIGTLVVIIIFFILFLF